MKRILCLLTIIGLLFTLAGCTKTLHCDRCNKEVIAKESSKAEEDWAIYCDECHEELFGDDPIISEN